MRLKAIVFDLDGTITDTLPLTIHSIQEVTRRLTGRILSDREVTDAFGPIDIETIKMFVGPEMGDTGVEEYVRYFADRFYDFVKPIKGIKELLELIREMGIATGIFTGRSMRVTKIILQKLGIEQLFNEIMTGDYTDNPKPDPEGIHKIFERFGIDTAAGAYVGDMGVDMQASKSAGTFSILALWSSTANEGYMKENPDKSFRSPYEMIDWLKSVLK